jgi:YD repeat-containing protein
LRRYSLAVRQSGNSLVQQSMAFDPLSGRWQSLSGANNNSAAYSYLANSPLVQQIVFAANGATRVTTTKQYDWLNRLAQISSAPSGASALSSAYGYNGANQRTALTNVDSSYWAYQYDALGQATNACRRWGDGTSVAGRQFQYQFDTIGNRTGTDTGGDASGANLRHAVYRACPKRASFLREHTLV